MVHELHKAGYQHVRISPGLAPSGCHWRCNITPAANIASDGFTIIDFDTDGGLVAAYSSSQEDAYFGWSDAAGMSARGMALRFLHSFPKIAKAGAGRDFPYAGWLTDVLGQAEQGTESDLIALYSDQATDAAYLRLWQPPPVSRDGGKG